ncbi:PREDICTED: ethylene receptor-like isoform X1 [Nicotiana attenuata]|uniref:ethylene receptor-like isoform X1 n=1 Tax=Nicotiana attenuata TaxID=49451 RepID=UPI00090582CA|nr:PREDICTED: ethylene receptor-like isoform X1 [Nicotiana attenuata]
MAKTENLKSNSSKDPSDSYSLEKFRLYETRARFYLIGSDRNKQFFRVLKIDRMEPSDLNISEDPVVYPPQEVKNLLQRIAEGNRATGGLNFVAKVYGIAETELTPEQRLMVETILKSSNPLATLINDVLDLSRLEDGSLQLDIRTSNLHALFREVKDTGSGINPQDIPKLFCKFAENQALGSKSSGGTGLGLAISKRFVNLMEGHIWIESEGLGKGSTAIFIVKLGIPGRSNEPKLPFMPRLPANHMQMTFQGLKVLGLWMITGL